MGMSLSAPGHGRVRIADFRARAAGLGRYLRVIVLMCRRFLQWCRPDEFPRNAGVARIGGGGRQCRGARMESITTGTVACSTCEGRRSAASGFAPRLLRVFLRDASKPRLLVGQACSRRRWPSGSICSVGFRDRAPNSRIRAAVSAATRVIADRAATCGGLRPAANQLGAATSKSGARRRGETSCSALSRRAEGSRAGRRSPPARGRRRAPRQPRGGRVKPNARPMINGRTDDLSLGSSGTGRGRDAVTGDW